MIQFYYPKMLLKPIEMVEPSGGWLRIPNDAQRTPRRPLTQGFFCEKKDFFRWGKGPSTMKQPTRNRQRTKQPPAAEQGGSSKLRSGKLLPLDYLLQVLNDPAASQQRRDRAARTAAPYCHARADSVPKKARQAKAAKEAGNGTSWAGDLDYPDGRPPE